MAERLESPLRCEQIAEAALTIVVEQGIGAVTVRRVAEAVGISAAALYRHYKNKGDILAAILEEHHEFHMANVRRALAEGRSPLDSLRIHYNGTMKLVARYRALPVIFLSDVVWFEEPRLRDLKMRHHATITNFLMDMVAKGQEQGEIRPDIRPRELVNHYIGMVAMPALMCARTPEDVDMTRQTAANWEMFARAVSV